MDHAYSNQTNFDLCFPQGFVIDRIDHEGNKYRPLRLKVKTWINNRDFIEKTGIESLRAVQKKKN